MKCPECESEMEDGYIPTTWAIHWRNKDQKIGLTPMLCGLKGTSSFFRKKMKARRCKSCEIVIFKYGSEVDYYK